MTPATKVASISSKDPQALSCKGQGLKTLVTAHTSNPTTALIVTSEQSEGQANPWVINTQNHQ